MITSHLHHGAARSAYRRPSVSHTLTYNTSTNILSLVKVSKDPSFTGRRVRPMSWWSRDWSNKDNSNHKHHQHPRQSYRSKKTIEEAFRPVERQLGSSRCFSKWKGSRYSSADGHKLDEQSGLPERERKWQQRIREFERRLEEDPYEALFGQKNGMLAGRGLRAFWDSPYTPKWLRDELGLDEDTNKANYAEQKPGAASKPDTISSPSDKSDIKKQQYEQTPTGSARDVASTKSSQFMFDPVTGRMIMKSPTQPREASSATQNSNEPVDIPVKPFRGGPASATRSSTEKVEQQPSEHGALEDALEEYELREASKLDTPTCAAKKKSIEKQLDTRSSLEEALGEYDKEETRSAHPAPVTSSQKATEKETNQELKKEQEELEEALEEYDERERSKPYKFPPPLDEWLVQEEVVTNGTDSASGKTTVVKPPAYARPERDPVAASLEEFEKRQQPPKPSPSLKEWLVQEGSPARTRPERDPVAASLEEFERRQQPPKPSPPPSEWLVQEGPPVYARPEHDPVAASLKEFERRQQPPKPSPPPNEWLVQEGFGAKSSTNNSSAKLGHSNDFTKRLASSQVIHGSQAFPRPNLSQDDLDLLTAEDIRANMGKEKHPLRETSEKKEKRRQQLEKDFESVHEREFAPQRPISIKGAEVLEPSLDRYQSPEKRAHKKSKDIEPAIMDKGVDFQQAISAATVQKMSNQSNKEVRVPVEESTSDPYSKIPQGLQTSYVREIASGRSLEDELAAEPNKQSQIDDGYSKEPMGLQTSYSRELAAGKKLENDLKARANERNPNTEDDGYSRIPSGLQTSYARELADCKNGLRKTLEQELKEAFTSIQSHTQELKTAHKATNEALTGLENTATKLSSFSGRIDETVHNCLRSHGLDHAYVFQPGKDNLEAELAAQNHTAASHQPSSAQPEPTVTPRAEASPVSYLILAYDPQTRRMMTSTSTSAPVASAGSTIALPSALARLSNPAAFLPYLPKQAEVVAAKNALLVLRNTSAPTAVSEGATARPAHPAAPAAEPQWANPTFSASPTGFVGFEEFDGAEKAEQHKENGSKDAKKGGLGRKLGAVVGLGALCYAVGVVAEVMK